MLSELNDKLLKLNKKLQYKAQIEVEADKIAGFLATKEKQLNNLKKDLNKANSVKKRLKRISLTNLLYTITNKKLEKITITQEKIEQLQTQYDITFNKIKNLQHELAEYKEKLSDMKNIEVDYENLLWQKEHYIYSNDSSLVNELKIYTKKEQVLEKLLQKYSSAIEAGTEAQEKLKDSLKSLDSAKGWSMFDMFGGGFFSTAIKHSHVSDSQARLRKAQQSLTKFQEQLTEIKNHLQLEIKIDGLLTFADYFFDGFFVDWFVHNKISINYEKAAEFYEDLDQLLARLKEDYYNFQHELQITRQEKVNFLESI